MPDLELHVHHKTSQAVLVSDDGDEKRAVWLAMSRVECADPVVGETTTFEVPEWVAQEKGLI